MYWWAPLCHAATSSDNVYSCLMQVGCLEHQFTHCKFGYNSTILYKTGYPQDSIKIFHMLGKKHWIISSNAHQSYLTTRRLQSEGMVVSYTDISFPARLNRGKIYIFWDHAPCIVNWAKEGF